MAFELRKKETIGDGIERNVRRQIEKALARLTAGSDPDLTVYEARKRFKQIRGALRLVRNELGEPVFHRENLVFRDAARPLAEARDAAVLVETFDKTVQTWDCQLDPEAFARIHARLAGNHQAVTSRLLAGQAAFRSAADAIEPVLIRLTDWSIEHADWPRVTVNLQRIHDKGGRALSAALAEPSVDNLHEWRKHAKYLWIALKFVKPHSTDDKDKLCGQAHNLSRLLGAGHDLAVLRHKLGADPLAYGPSGTLENLFSVIKERRENLKQDAFTVGRSIYQGASTDFNEGLLSASLR